MKALVQLQAPTRQGCWRLALRLSNTRARQSFLLMQLAPLLRRFMPSHAAGSVSVTPRATTSRPSLMTSQYQRPSSPLGIMRNSTFAMPCCLRPEMSFSMNQDTLHCAAPRAQKSTQAQLSALRGNIGHLIHRRAAFLAVSWSHHRFQRLDRPNGFLAGSRGVGHVVGLSLTPVASFSRTPPPPSRVSY